MTTANQIQIRYNSVRYRKVDIVIWKTSDEDFETNASYGFAAPGIKPDNYPYLTMESAAKVVRKMIKTAIETAIANGTNTIDVREFVS